jgi:hypothetical protein
MKCIVFWPVWPPRTIKCNNSYNIDNVVSILQDSYVKSGAAKSVITFLVRFGNTWFGGLQWMAYARMLGVQ